MKNNEMIYISVTEWENIPKDYKIDTRPEPYRLSKEAGAPRQVFAGCIVKGGGTTLLTEGTHFEILPDLDAVKKQVAANLNKWGYDGQSIADDIEEITEYYKGKPAKVRTSTTDPKGRKCELYLF